MFSLIFLRFLPVNGSSPLARKLINRSSLNSVHNSSLISTLLIIDTLISTLLISSNVSVRLVYLVIT